MASPLSLGGAGTKAKAEAAAAAKASPELVSALSKEMGSTPEQAAGAAGTRFAVAKSRLKADEFSQIAKAVPGMSSLLAAAPAVGGAAGGVGGALSQVAGTLGVEITAPPQAVPLDGLNQLLAELGEMPLPEQEDRPARAV
jgi:hypothetical protein